MKIEAHQREILAVSFSPAVDHLILTGSADNVCSSFKPKGEMLSIICRLSPSMICAPPPRSYTLSSLTQMKCSMSLGHHTIHPSLPLHRAIGESTSGTCHKLELNRHRTTRKTGPPNYCSFMVVSDINNSACCSSNQYSLSRSYGSPDGLLLGSRGC